MQIIKQLEYDQNVFSFCIMGRSRRCMTSISYELATRQVNIELVCNSRFRIRNFRRRIEVNDEFVQIRGSSTISIIHGVGQQLVDDHLGVRQMAGLVRRESVHCLWLVRADRRGCETRVDRCWSVRLPAVATAR